jgi:hypothetical protein
MDRYAETQRALNIASLGGLYLSNKMYRYKEPQTALTIALHGGLYLAVIMAVIEGPKMNLLYPCIEATK